jgi:hypothetical protein
MDKNNLKEKTIQEKEINKLDDEELEKVSGGTGDNGETSDPRAKATEAFNAVNKARREAGLDELDWNTNLEDVYDSVSIAKQETGISSVSDYLHYRPETAGGKIIPMLED